jgi:hypothetical protein
MVTYLVLKMKLKIYLPVLISTLIVFAFPSCKSTPQKAVDVFSKLSPDEKAEFNRFFTDFSEIYTEPFASEGLNDIIMIRFGVYHNYRNNYDAFEQDSTGMMARINEKLVDETVSQFFGSHISKHQATNEITYENKMYGIQNADGEAYRFSRLDSLFDTGDDVYTAYVSVYVASSGWTGDINASPESWKQNSDSDDIPQLDCKMKSTIKKITENEKTRYILIDYLKR